jgi:sterol 3beta-glucosyltransferase
MIYGCWKSCYETLRGTKDVFVVDAIISNPPGFAHVHCAEALGIPLQMSFSENLLYILKLEFYINLMIR